MKEKMSVGILLFENAEVLDFAGPFEVFSVTSELNNHELFDVFTIGETRAPIIAVNGLSVNPKFDIKSCPHIDILIIPGGYGTRDLTHNSVVLNWINKAYLESEITMSICSGATLLGTLGLLDDRPYCTHHEVYERMQSIVPTGIPQPNLRFVCADKIYTSGGISAGIDLSFHVVEKLHGLQIAERTAKYMEYERKE